MKGPEPSRIRDQRVDIKVGPEVYKSLKNIKALLEAVRVRPFSMSEVIMLLCQWSEPSIFDLSETHAKLTELTTKKTPSGRQY